MWRRRFCSGWCCRWSGCRCRWAIRTSGRRGGAAVSRPWPRLGMSSAAHSERLRPYVAGSLFGLWAAAIALAPSLAAKAALASPALLIPVAWWTVQRPGRWISLFLATALLLPPLPIAIGDSGPHLCLLFAALGLLAGALWAGEWHIEITGVGAALIALLGVL